jgi:GAF domain-containing protein
VLSPALTTDSAKVRGITLNSEGDNTTAANPIHELRRFREIVEKMNNEWSPEGVLNSTCQAVVELFNIDHSGLVEFDHELGTGVVRAEYPESFGTLRSTISTGNIIAEQQLIRDRKSIHFPDLRSAESRNALGDVHQQLWDHGVRGVLIVPIIGGEKVIGSFSLDSTRGPRSFSPLEIEECELLASIASGALDKIHASDVGAEISEAIINNLSLASLPDHIAKTAKQYLRATAAELRTTPQPGKLARRIMQQQIPFFVIEAGKGTDPNQHELWALLGAPDTPSGALIVKIPAERKIIAEDIRTLRYLAQYSYIALERRRAVETEQFLREIGDLTATATEPQELLKVLAHRMASFFEMLYCLIVASDTRGIPLHVVAATADGSVERREDYREQDLLALVRSQPTTAGSLSTVLSPAQSVLIFAAFKHGSESGEHGMARMFCLESTPEIGTWLILGSNGDAKPQSQPFSESVAADAARRINSFIAKTHLQAGEQRQHDLVVQLNRVFAEHPENLSWEKQCLEIARQSLILLGADGAALTDVAEASGRMIVIKQSAEKEPRLPGDIALTSKMLEALRSGLATLVDVTPNGPETWGPEFGARPCAMALVPVRGLTADHNHALLVWKWAQRGDGRDVFSKGELGILDLYATRVSAVLSRTLTKGWDVRPSHLALLADLAEYAVSGADPAKIYLAALTAITAGYGLRFNRAAFFLVSGGAATPQLYGERGIGAVEHRTARENWKEFESGNRKTFRDYLASLRQQDLPHQTQLDRRIGELRIPISEEFDDPFQAAFREERGRVRFVHEFTGRAAEDFKRSWFGDHVALTGGEPIAVVPLYTRWPKVAAGILVADNWHTEAPITSGDVDLLALFGDVAVHAAKRRGQAPADDAPPLDRAYPEQILRALINQIRRRYADSGVAVILVDQEGVRAREYAVEGLQKPEGLELADIIRPHGISHQVFRTGRAEVMPDRDERLVNPAFQREGWQEAFSSSVCVPFTDRIGCTGVVWLHTVNKIEKDSFEREHLPKLMSLVEQYAAAYRQARASRDARLFSRAQQKLGDPRNPRKAMKDIEVLTREEFRLRACYLFASDGNGHLVPALKPEGKAPTPSALEVLSEALAAGYAQRESLNERENAELPSGVRSIQAVRIGTHAAQIAVLLLCYAESKVLDAIERERLEQFGRIAGSALDHAHSNYVVDQRLRVADWLQLVKPTDNLDVNLTTLAKKIQNETRAPKVVLSSYDPISCTLQHPPGMAGVRDIPGAVRTGKVEPDSFLYRLHRLERPLYLSDINERPEFKEARFARQEGVRSVAVLPLRGAYDATRHEPSSDPFLSGHDSLLGADGAPSEAPEIKPDLPGAGLLFLNYTAPQEFDEETSEDLAALAEVVSEAVNAAQIYANDQRLQARLDALVSVPAELFYCQDRQKVIDLVLDKATELLKVEFANLITRTQDRGLKQEGQRGWGEAYQAGHLFSEDEGQHARFTILSGGDTAVDDFNLPQAFDVAKDIRSRKVRSGLGVPMKLPDGSVVGALLVHTIEVRHFAERDRVLLRMLATEVALKLAELAKKESANKRQSESLQLTRESIFLAQQLSGPFSYLNSTIELALQGKFGTVQPRLEYKLKVAQGALRNGWRTAQNIFIPDLLEESVRRVEKPAPVAGLLQQIVDRWFTLAQAGGKIIRLDLGNVCGLLARMDEYHFMLLVENLVANALRWASGKGPVEINADLKDDDMIWIEVSDNGPGPDPAILEWLRESAEGPLPTGMQTTTRFGRGLEITRRIVECNEGRLEVPDDEPQGCRIRAVLHRWPET